MCGDSIKDASSKIAKELVAQYATKDNAGVHVLGGYPGVLYPPYYWWLAGAMFGTLLDYWRYTGDDQYNDMMREGMIHQFGEKLDLVGCYTSVSQCIALTPADAQQPIEERRKR